MPIQVNFRTPPTQFALSILKDNREIRFWPTKHLLLLPLFIISRGIHILYNNLHFIVRIEKKKCANLR